MGVIYMANLGTVAQEYHQTLYWKFMARDILGRAGWVINEKKDQLPSQSNVLLGSVCDTLELKFKIPEKKVAEIKDLLKILIKQKRPHVKLLAGAIGKICSFYRSTGALSCLMTRSCYRVIASAPSWNCNVILSEQAIEELGW